MPVDAEEERATATASAEARKRAIRRTIEIVCVACVLAAIWNFVPFWFVHDSISEPMRALWIWGVFPLSIPIFYAFIDRYYRR